MKSPKSAFSVFALAASVWLNLSPAPRAATLTVTSTADSGAGTLRQAIADAGSGDTIVFDPSLAGQTIYLLTGQLTVNVNLAIDASALPGGMTVSADTFSTVLDINSGTAIVKSLTLTDAGSTYTGGGLVVNSGAQLTVYNSIISSNSVYNQGGGLNNAGTLALYNCTIAGNSAAFYGGGIYNAGTLTLSNCTVSANVDAAYFGGGIYNAGTLTMTNCVVSGNVEDGYYGGGLYNYSGAQAALDHCVFANNVANGGGGIYNASTLTLNACTVSGNDGGSYGGNGIATSSTTTLNNCTISGNTGGATYGGGGIYAASCTCVLDNCTVSGNIGEGPGGGGIGINGGTLLLTNCTISANAVTNNSQNGGGICWFSYTTIYLANTIVASNTAANGAYPDIYGVYSGQNYIVGGNPQLAPLGNYGGPTPTMPPLPGSPAIDAGADTITNSLATDQRGYPRLAGLHVDLGAAEGVYNAAGAGILTGATRLANGTFQFGFTNYPDMTFTVYAATNLALPFDRWSNVGLAVGAPAGSGQFQFTDAGATNAPPRFYRVASPGR